MFIQVMIKSDDFEVPSIKYSYKYTRNVFKASKKKVLTVNGA